MMKEFFKPETKTLLSLSLLVIGLQAVAFYFSQQGQTGMLLSVFLLLLTVLALLAGPVVGLVGSLFSIFVMGTFLIVLFLRPNTFISPLTVSLQSLLVFGFILLLTVLVAGAIHDQIVQQHRHTRKLQKELRVLVAVDSETGFDNRHRIEGELDIEIGRTNRYGGAFTLIILKIDFLEEFHTLYGDKEYTYLLTSLADHMQSVIRSTDRKFRYAEDRFALLLTHTGDAFIDVVFEKLKKSLQNHQLSNGKYISLTFRVAHEVYTKEKNMHSHVELIEQLESEMLVCEL